MNDIITDEERVLIDEAVSQGRVRKIPTGVRSQEPEDFTYSEVSGRLVSKDKEAALARLRKGLKWGRGKNK